MLVKKPHRKRQSHTIEMQGAPDAVFALMCPVREYDWVPGWQTNAVYSNSGVAELDCMFTTPCDVSEAIWVVSSHDMTSRSLTMYKIVPGLTVTRLDIAIVPEGIGSAATISYELTALGEEGKALVDAHTDDQYRTTMAQWKEHLDHYLLNKAA